MINQFEIPAIISKANSDICMNNYKLDAKPQLDVERQRTGIINATILTAKMDEIS